MEYNGELTFSQILRILRYDIFKWIICVAAAVIATLSITLSIYYTQTTVGYTATYVYTVSPSSAETEIAGLKNTETVYSALVAEGYTDEQIANEDMVDKIVSHLSAYSVSDTTYKVSLTGVSFSGFTDERYNSLVNAIVRSYASAYRAEKVAVVPLSMTDFDCSTMDYIAATDYLTSKYTQLLTSIQVGIDNSTLTAYIDDETGYSFYDIKNIFNGLSDDIELFRLYVTSNAVVRAGVDVTAKEYISGRLSYYEAQYEEQLFEYNSLMEVFNTAANSSGFGTTTTTESSTKVVVDDSFYTLVNNIKTAAAEVAETKSALASWRNIWLDYGGTIEYAADGSATYSGDNFAGATSDRAEEMFNSLVANIKGVFETYNAVANRFNDSILNSGLVYISSYASKSVTYKTSQNLITIINIAIPLAVFLIFNFRSYIILKKKGAFQIKN